MKAIKQNKMKTQLLTALTAVILFLMPNVNFGQAPNLGTVLTGPTAPELGTAAYYAIFTSVGAVSNVGVTYVAGDIGSNVGAVTGFDPLLVTGTIHLLPDGSTAQCAADLLDEEDKGQDLYADSAYTGEEQEKTISKYEMNNKVHEKGYRNKPLTEEQKKSNAEKSKIRVRVEHVFGFMEQSMNGLKLRSIGIIRATGIIGLINLTYNLFRYEQVIRLNII